MPATEHILLESDHREVPDIGAARKVNVQVRINSRLRRRVVQLDIIDYYYLSVRSWGWRSSRTPYVLDLRFIDAKPQLSRHIAWRWIWATIVLAATTGLVLRLHFGPPQWWHNDWLSLSAIPAVAGMLTAIVGAYRTTETVALHSSDGRAKVFEHIGGLGTIRAARLFLAKLVAHIHFAATARRSSRTAHLRDEMREHSRLNGLGVLTTEEYEASKAFILRQHSLHVRPPARERQRGIELRSSKHRPS
jgi:hypothetical protein